MAKAPTSVVGIDLGRHSLKAVHLQTKSHGRVILTSFASREVGEGIESNPDQLAYHLKLLVRDLGVSSKACAVAISSPHSLLRIIEQPITPPKFLRQALRLQGLQLLNQDCRDFVLDCDLIPNVRGAIPADDPVITPNSTPRGNGNGHTEISDDRKLMTDNTKRKYLVGGIPRTQVAQLQDAFSKSKLNVVSLQLAPISNFNAFEYVMDDPDRDHSFLLVDIGFEETRVLAGCGEELVLIRSVDYGATDFLEAVSSEGAIDKEAAILLIEQGDAGMAETGRNSLAGLAHELRSSIGFFEGQHERTISRAFFSGSLVKSELPLQILSDELEMPCGTWDPFARHEISLPKNKMIHFSAERPHLNVACGAALELLQVR